MRIEKYELPLSYKSKNRQWKPSKIMYGKGKTEVNGKTFKLSKNAVKN